MNRLSFCLACVVAFLSLTETGWAHKVNVFAFVDGDHIQVECSFSRSQKVKSGKVVASDLETGEVIAEGVTDGQGLFLFRPPDDFLRTGHGLRLRLQAGEGHQDDWTLSGEELRALSPTAPAPRETGQAVSTRQTETTDEPRAATRSDAIKPAALPPGIDAAELEAIIDRALDEKLAPLKQALVRRRDDDPDLRDIVGGIGWIAGLLGLVAYLKYRRRTRHD